MTKARDLANIISGGFTASDIPNLDTAKITSGTFADARLPATALNSNVDLTNLSASNLTSGTVATARLGSGTADATTFLRGDGSFATPVGGDNKPYFFTSKTSNQSINDDTVAKITFPASSFHSASNVFDHTNSKFTVATAGVYQLNAKATLESSGGGRFYSIELRIYKNGSQITGNVFHDRDDTNQDLIEQFTLSESTLVNASVNDYFEIYVYGDTESGDAWTINGSSNYITTFSAYKLIT